jgi:CheY-like chemotaxis protein
MPLAGTILVVDDSPDDVALLLRTFRQLGIVNRIHVCDGGRAALDYLFQDLNSPPSIILLDLKMPGVDGFQVLRKIKNHPILRDIVVIVLTTSSDRMDIQLGYELGANSFLTKPLDLDEFREMVSAFHKYWLIRSQPPEQRGRWIKPPNGGGSEDPKEK